MTTLVTGPQNQVSLPTDVCARHRWQGNIPVRVIETRHGVLLIPLTDAPMSDELRHELEDWQALGALTWAMFPYHNEK